MKNILTFLFLIAGLSTIVYGAPKSEYTPFWDKYDNNNRASISHADYDKFLGKYVKIKNGINYINYGGVSSTDKAVLKGYIKRLERMPILSYSQDEQEAYWINMYNALTIDVILNAYPLDSIKETPKSIFNSGPWNQKLLEIEGRDVTLNDIEHKILRPLWTDPRVHFLVNCASIGCPNIGTRAITKDNYEATAEQATKDFINHSRAVTLNGNTLVLTSLIDWYGLDFGRNMDEIIAYLNRYANASTKAKLKNYKSNRIKYEYDWNLNVEENIL